MKTITVKVQHDHLERLSSSQKPILSIIELIWNALDADAKLVKVDVERNSLDGTTRITVIDDGHGINYDKAASFFENLGGSWKLLKDRTRGGRLLHGRLGKGRFRAFALGNVIFWKTRYEENGNLYEYKILGSRENLGTFQLEDPELVEKSHPGTTVEITSTTDPMPNFDTQRSTQILAENLAMYLKQYPEIEIFFDGEIVRSVQVVEMIDEYELGPIRLRDGSEADAKLTIIEWTIPTKRALYLCDEAGFTIEEAPVGIHAPGFEFTAYLWSSLIRKKYIASESLIVDMDPDLRPLLEEARNKLREHFRLRNIELKSQLIEHWKDEKVYPYMGNPRSPIEKAERQVFDIVAINVAEHMPDFHDYGAKNKRLTFSLMKEALESSPTSLTRILEDVLSLPEEKKKELLDLLEKTSLDAIINASKVVANRLDFLGGLELLVFEPGIKEHVLERRNLHKIVADNTWIFGEEYALALSDRSLTNVLRKHLEGREIDILDDSPVVQENGRTGIIDLMLSGTVFHSRAEEREHLIVELKRPTVKIASEELSQIKKYAFAIADDERFKDTKTKWVFWALSHDLSSSVRHDANQRDRPHGQVYVRRDGQIEVWIKTWGQILEECRGRLHFYQQELEYKVDNETSKKYLREMHAKHLPPILQEEV